MSCRLRSTVGLLGLALAGCQPMTASTQYTPHVIAAKTVSAAPCALRVAEIVDERMDPSVLGSVGGRTVKGPKDSQAWLHSVLSGLGGSGIRVSFNEPDGQGSGDLSAGVELKTAWVSSETTSKVASVVLRFHYFRAGAPLKSAEYRGSIASPNWSSAEGEIQGMIDRAFDKALAQAARDVLAQCAAPAAVTAAR
jgi:hypothetical protein